MLIIKPYGKSVTENNIRSIVRELPTGNCSVKENISSFVKENDRIVIAQWVSVIDKIIQKPKPNKKASPKQHDIREMIGNACWEIIQNKNMLQGNDGELRKIWDWKIKPYEVDRKIREGRIPEGRWYKSFVNNNNFIKENAEQIAQQIYEHLYENALCIDKKNCQNRIGLIEHRANSISKNTLNEKITVISWDENTFKEYCMGGDVAKEIKREAEKNKRIFYDMAAKKLFEHWACIFKNNAGLPLTIKEAEETKKPLFDLHMAVKDYYRRTLKDHKRTDIVRILPSNMSDLYKRIKQKETNKDINALIRLGKIIHYESSGANEDSTSFIVDKFPAKDAIKNSIYWTSDAQQKIKRNEAFVRVWRSVLSYTARTLKDWADPNDKIKDDILGSESIKTIKENYTQYANPEKAALLFNYTAFNNDPEVLGLALAVIANLRNNSFHFKGLGSFASTLKTYDDKLQNFSSALIKIKTFWEDENFSHQKQIIQMMEGSHSGRFFNKEQNEKIFNAVSLDDAIISLPRFGRILLRSENAWKTGENQSFLPNVPNRDVLEKYPSLLCQYTALKLLYETSFKVWLVNCNANILNVYIKKSVERSTNAAKTINARNVVHADLIKAKATELGGIEEAGNIDDFFFKLSAAMASEMRIQRGYDSNSEKAREQAEYIEDLKCDVLLLAFQDFIKDRGFTFITNLKSESSAKTVNAMSGLQSFTAQKGAEEWQHILYFVLHLVSVEDVSALLHQIYKWEILAQKGNDTQKITGDIQNIVKVLKLYIARHDAKFSGGMTVNLPEEYLSLFESVASIGEVLPQQGKETQIPIRGLREMQRFGQSTSLMPRFEKCKITKDQIDRYNKLAECIEVHQKKREDLHSKWVKEKSLSDENKKQYAIALQAVIEFRALAHHVFMKNYINLHRLQMAVLGRLVDYSGLWERDLYFVTLAVLYKHGKTPSCVMNKEAKKYFKKGLIVKTINGIQDAGIKDEIKSYFGASVFETIKEIRNDFAHFNMLQKGEPQICLTEQVNQARKLMAYDRKLKNAVSKSIIELLAREGVILNWQMNNHVLESASISSKSIEHIKDKQIHENLLSVEYLKMIADLFSGAINEKKSIIDEDITQIQFNMFKGGRWNHRFEKNHKKDGIKRMRSNG